MAVVYIASSLARHAEGERLVVLDGSTVEEVLDGLGDRYPGFREEVFDREGKLRPHITLFLNNRNIMAKSDLRTSVGQADEIAMISAIAGG
jgi:molybdopterin converting factor small subunit